jgi:NDP-sugar pyrophosphorylase family protein
MRFEGPAYDMYGEVLWSNGSYASTSLVEQHHDADVIANDGFLLTNQFVVEKAGLAGHATGDKLNPDVAGDPFLVMNGDILTNLNFHALLAFHREHRADATVAVRKYDLTVPYGVVECEGTQVKALQEKPTERFLVSAGIYLLEPTVLGCIPPGERFDMTELIQVLLQQGRTVVSFPIVEYWLDIGRAEDYERAQSDVETVRL